MDTGSPDLGVDFVINFGDSFGGLKSLDDLIGTTSANAVRDFQRIQASVANGLGLDAAAAQFKSLGDTVTRELRSAAQEAARVERAGESLVRQLERQNATYGKTREEIRGMRIEEAALAAERTKNTDLAARLRTEQTLLTTAEKETAQAAERQAQALREAAVAHDMFEARVRAGVLALKEEEAVLKASALEAHAQDLREAAQAHQMFESRVRAGVAAMKEEEAVFKAASLAAYEQDLRSAAFAHGQFEAAARRGMAALREQEAAAASDAAALAQLRAMIDPAAAAQDRLNAEMAEASRVMKAAGASAEEVGRAHSMLADRANISAKQQDVMAGSARKSGFALQTIALQLPDITQGLLTGQKPMTVFIQQGFQIVQVGMMAQGGLRGFGKEVAALALRFSPLLVGLAAVGAGFALFNRWVNEGVKNEQLTSGLGKITGGADATKQELFKLKDATITWADTSSALFSVVGKDIAQAFVGDMKGMSSDVKTLLDDLTSYGRSALAGLYAGLAGTKSYLAEIEKGGLTGLAKMAIGQGDPKLLEKTYGAAYDTADKYLTKLGARVKAAAIVNARTRLADKIGYNNEPKPKTDKHAEQLAREAEAIEAQIRNLYKLADAYGVSGAAALIAEARVKAESKAIKQRADIEAAVDREIRLSIAQRVSDAAKLSASMRDQARIQTEVNTMVAAGNVPAERAAALVQERIADLPLLAALEAAQQRGLKVEADKATAALKAQQDARADVKAGEIGAFYAGAAQQAERQLVLQRKELELVGATDMERARAMATIEATQRLQAEGYDLTSSYAKGYIADQVAIATGAETNRQAQDAYNASLTATGDLFDTIDQSAQSAASGISDAFGRVGTAVSDALTIVTGFYADQARLQEQHAAAIKNAGGDEVRIARENQLFAIRSSSQQISAYGNMASAAKGFFKEGSGGYKAMAAAEKVYRVAQLAMSIASIIQNGAETVSAVANSTARATAAGAEGIATQAKLPFPANIAAMAATGAALVAAGIAVFGGGGGGSSAPSVKTAEDYQKLQGTGSVLGDASAKSESIANALDLMMKNSNRDLEYSSSMVQSLRAIESGIGNLAAAVARETKVGGGLDASSLGLGTNTGGGLLGVGGLFSKTITRELNDAGLQFDGASVASVIAGGITANLYQEVLKTTKKSGFLGIGGSTKTTVETIRTGADSGLTNEVSLLINSMRTAIVGAAGTIGIDGATAMLDAFQINIGRISFKGLTSDEIEAELAAVFSRVGDDMASAIGGGLSSFQRAGEGMLETLVRLAKEYTTVDVTLRSIGMTFGSVGLASVGARTALVELFGGLDEFIEQTGFFRENFLSEAEQMAPVIAAVRDEMNRLGLSGVATKDAFKSVVLGLDLSSASGRETYAALMSVAPAFAKTSDYLASLNGELQDTAKTAEQLAAIEKQRRGLDIQLMEATGDAVGALAAKRADDLAGMDETLRALQQQVWGAQDAAQAARDLAAADAEVARAATTLATQRRGLEIDLMEAIGNSVGAVAAKRADEIAALDASLRPLKDQIYAAQDAAAANAVLAEAQNATAEAARQLADQRRTMEISLMEAIGDAAGASAAKRADELAAIDATLRPLQEAIYAAQDAAAAQTALADAQNEAAQSAIAFAEQRRGLEIQLMEATGDATGALTAKRADELAALDVGLRALQSQVWAAQDAATANAALAEAQQSAAQAAMQAAAQIAQQRAALQISLLRAQGMEGQAVNAERDLQLAATDESLRALQAQVWAAEDARAAAEAAAQAQAAYAQQQQQMANDAEQLRKQQVGMQAQLLDLLGNATGATILRRQEELAALDASLRPLQQSIWAQEDLAAAATAAADRVSTARDTLTDSYKRESDALQETIDRFASFGDGLRKFRSELGNGGDATVDAYRAAQARFVDTSALAAKGDVGALGELEAISKDFLTASRDRAGSLAEYQRDVARVAGSVDRAIGASDEAVDYAKAQLDALKASVGGLIEVDASVVSVRDAIIALQAAIASSPSTPAKVPDAPVTSTGTAQPIQVSTAQLERIIDANAARSDVQVTTMAETLGKIQRRLDQWDGGGLLVRTDDDTPLHVTSTDA